MLISLQNNRTNKGPEAIPTDSITSRGDTSGPSLTRRAILGRLRSKVQAGKPIIGAGAGTGLSAKCAEAGGIDLIASITRAVTGWQVADR